MRYMISVYMIEMGVSSEHVTIKMTHILQILMQYLNSDLNACCSGLYCAS